MYVKPNETRKAYGLRASDTYQKLKQDAQTQVAEAIQAIFVLFMT